MDGTTTKRESNAFRVGWLELHPDASLNFQLNRWLAYRTDAFLVDIRSVAPRLTSYAAWIEAFLALAERAQNEGRRIDAAYHRRSAEFFMKPGDPRKRDCRERFVATMREAYAVTSANRDAAPFEKTRLPIYRFSPAQSRSAIVLFGGFDSYIEELFPLMRALADRGYDVVCFEGPGQGAVLEDGGVAMTPDWHRPVGAVLDHLALTNVTLVGISLGGCLAIRAAAHEPRIARVVAFDALSDFLECMLRPLPAVARHAVPLLLHAAAGRAAIDRLAVRAAREPVADWGLAQAMHVFGASTPHDAFRAAAGFRTDDVSHLARQDVLLLAGAEDHYVPTHQIYDQARWLTRARSVTTRLFTRADHAQSHCQVGNMGLALGTIATWIDAMPEHRHVIP